jgi:hypothetical protein
MLQAMSDYDEIATLIGRYSQLGDDGEHSSRADLFASDATYVGPDGTPIIGRDAIRARPAPPRGPEVLGGKHMTSNLVLVIDGDTASSVVDFIHFRKTAEGLRPNTMGRYEDEFTKVDGVWLIKSRRVAIAK